MAVALARNQNNLLGDLADALAETGERVRSCSQCGSITSADEQPCRLCTGAGRDGSLLCVVEDPLDIVMLERAGNFRGRYHALMGKLSPMRGRGPDDLRVKALIERVRKEGFREVVLALSTDVEGDATASFVSDMLRDSGVKVTRLAFGLPAGSGIGYSDPVTLARAFSGRTGVS
jgi:recombination protein RecR